MQVAIKGLTNDYAQYLRDKIDARSLKISEKELQELRVRKSSYAELQEAAANPQGNEKGIIILDEEIINMAGMLSSVQNYRYDPYLRGSNITRDIINEMGKRSTIDTPFGEMRVGVKFDEKTTLYLDNLA